MIFPLVAAYILFAWISSYNDEKKVDEYFRKQIDLHEIKTTLNDPSLYTSKVNEEVLEEITGEAQFVTLYNAYGLVTYTTDPTINFAQYNLGKENLFTGLYELKQGYHSYQYKEPVFAGNDLVGVYEVELARDEWVEGVSDRSWWMIGIFITVFLVIYVIVIRFVNKKLNKPITGLMNEMTSYARGETIIETETKPDEIGELKRHFYSMRKEINKAREEVEKEHEQKEFMIASISHDLKTPLTSIKAYAESLEMGIDLTSSERDEYEKVIVDKADFMKQMLDDLLMYTLLQSSTYEIDLVEVDGVEFFDMLMSGYDAMCKDKQINLETEVTVSGRYFVNPKQMMRVTDNLISNAIKHTNQCGTIHLATISEGEMPEWLFTFIPNTFDFDHFVYLIVQNTGKGISASKMEQLFSPLYQVDQARSKRDDHGTGLGLSITKQIIEKHDGKVSIYSQIDEGTCVICRLPKIKIGRDYKC